VEFLINILVLFSMVFLTAFHCWCVSALFSYRFGPLKGTAWFLAIILVPLLGSLVFYFVSRRHRELNRPSRRREIVWFTVVFGLFSAAITTMGVMQYSAFMHRAADADAMSAVRTVHVQLLSRIEKTGQAPEGLSEIGYVADKPAVHITYKRTGPDTYELTGWHDKGNREMRMTNTSNEIERRPLNRR